MIDPEKLHRIHASPASAVGGCSVDIGEDRWRGDGSKKGEYKRQVARRIAVTWNVCEGWPTDALEAGALKEVDDAVRNLIAVAEKSTTDTFPVDICNAIGRLRVALYNRDLGFDFTDGRAHDCDVCPKETEEKG